MKNRITGELYYGSTERWNEFRTSDIHIKLF